MSFSGTKPSVDIPQYQAPGFNMPGFGGSSFQDGAFQFNEDPTQQQDREQVEAMRRSVLTGLGITSPQREASRKRFEETFFKESQRLTQPKLEQSLFERGLGGSKFYQDSVTDLLSKIGTQSVLQGENLQRQDEQGKLNRLATLQGMSNDDRNRMSQMMGFSVAGQPGLTGPTIAKPGEESTGMSLLKLLTGGGGGAGGNPLDLLTSLFNGGGEGGGSNIFSQLGGSTGNAIKQLLGMDSNNVGSQIPGFGEGGMFDKLTLPGFGEGGKVSNFFNGGAPKGSVTLPGGGMVAPTLDTAANIGQYASTPTNLVPPAIPSNADLLSQAGQSDKGIGIGGKVAVVASVATIVNAAHNFWKSKADENARVGPSEAREQMANISEILPKTGESMVKMVSTGVFDEQRQLNEHMGMLATFLNFTSSSIPGAEVDKAWLDSEVSKIISAGKSSQWEAGEYQKLKRKMLIDQVDNSGEDTTSVGGSEAYVDYMLDLEAKLKQQLGGM